MLLVNVEVNEGELLRFCNDFDLPDVRIKVTPHAAGGKFYGLMTPPAHVELFIGGGIHAGSALRFVTHKINETLLHELRHVWQYKNWSTAEWEEKEGAYWSGSKKELDAREFAASKIGSYRLVRVTRPVARSGLSRLSAIQARLKR